MSLIKHFKNEQEVKHYFKSLLDTLYEVLPEYKCFSEQEKGIVDFLLRDNKREIPCELKHVSVNILSNDCHIQMLRYMRIFCSKFGILTNIHLTLIFENDGQEIKVIDVIKGEAALIQVIQELFQGTYQKQSHQDDFFQDLFGNLHLTKAIKRSKSNIQYTFSSIANEKDFLKQTFNFSGLWNDHIESYLPIHLLYVPPKIVNRKYGVPNILQLAFSLVSFKWELCQFISAIVRYKGQFITSTECTQNIIIHLHYKKNFSPIFPLIRSINLIESKNGYNNYENNLELIKNYHFVCESQSVENANEYIGKYVSLESYINYNLDGGLDQSRDNLSNSAFHRILRDYIQSKEFHILTTFKVVKHGNEYIIGF